MKKIIPAVGAAIIVLSAFVMVSKDGIDHASMDKKVDPADDFFKYVNGNWLRKNPIPPAEARWGSFIMLAENNTLTLKNIMESAAADKSAAPGSVRQKVGDFYRIAMDTVKLEKEGVTPALADMKAIEKISTPEEIIPLLASFHKKGVSGFFGMYVGQDVKNNEIYKVWLTQGGLGLPDKDYYLKQDEKSKKIRMEYVIHISKMFQLFGSDEKSANEAAGQILVFETSLAENCMSRVENRNMEKKYNLRSVNTLISTMPALRWDVYFKETGLTAKNIDTVIVAQPEFFAALDRSMRTTPIENLKAYMKWKLIASTSGYMNQALSTQNFYFYGTVIQGTKEQKPRWKRTVGSANGLIGELVAQEYVKVAFSPEAKKKVNEMVDNLRDAYKVRIENLEWMSPETKKKALEKLASFNRKLGYPDKWKDQSGLVIRTDSYLANYYRSQLFDHEDMIDRLGKPVDRTEWNMTPQTVNAYYSPVMNEIVFPAAIMQSPFFDPKADDAVNYGAIGAVIGHEFSHGFDDQGSKYDAKGNFNSWWTAEDRTKFDARTKVLVDQFNKYKVADSVYVNGELTLGENIADIAGLLVAYDAYQISMKGKKKEKINGYTPEQRFFIGFAQVWRGHARPEYERNQVVTDPHSPQQFRVYGPLSNMPAFYTAFDVKPGNKMWRDEADRVKIW